MKDAESELAALFAKVFVLVVGLFLVVALWVFVNLVRLAARLIVQGAIDRGWSDGEPGGYESAIRLAGAAVGGLIGLILACFVLAQGGPPALALGVIAAAGIGGCIAAPEGKSPWRSRPVGDLVDDWIEIDDGYR